MGGFKRVPIVKRRHHNASSSQCAGRRRAAPMAPPRITVDVALCSQAHTLQRNLRSPPISSIDRNASDLESILVRALHQRFRPRRNAAAVSSLVYIPQQCLGQPGIQIPKYALPFSAFGYWGNGGKEALRDRLCRDGAPTSQSLAALSRLAVLWVDGPSYRPLWRGPTAKIIYDSIASTPPPGAALAMFQVPYPSVGAWDGTRLVPSAPRLNDRPALVALFANHKMRSGAAIGRAPLRTLLTDECGAAAEGQCLTLPEGDAMVRTGVLSPATVLDAYQRAVFCLQPWGDLAVQPPKSNRPQSLNGSSSSRILTACCSPRGLRSVSRPHRLAKASGMRLLLGASQWFSLPPAGI